jgi:hypothetical protein
MANYSFIPPTIKWLLGILFLLPLSLPAQDLHIAAYYYPWYDKQHWQEGYIRSQMNPPQLPLLGEYRSKDREVIRQHQAWSETYGIDSWICSWWGKGKKTDRILKKSILPELEGSPTKVALFYESAGILGMKNGRIRIDREAIRQLEEDVEYLAVHYFDHPNYLKVAGRPVLFLYLTRAFYGELDTAFRTIRSTAQAYGFDLYLVGDEVFWQLPNRNTISLLDGITPYNMHGPWQFNGYPEQTGFFREVDRKYQLYQYTARKNNTSFIPNAFPGFNDKGVRPEANHYLIPPQSHPDSNQVSTFRTYLDIAKKYVDPDIKMLTITSFNEWHEDTQIEPVRIPLGKAAENNYGMKFLELIRALDESR